VNHASVPAVLHMAERSLFTRMRAAAAEGDVRVGWKVGHAIAEIDRLGARLPAVGWISTQTVLADGGAYRVRDARALRAETEFAIELKRSVGPDADTNTVCGAIAGLRVALEIVDVARPPHDPRAIVEGNLFHRAVVFGARLGPIAATASAATLGINGSIHEQHEDPICPVSAVRDVARVLDACGEALAPGDRILSGSVIHIPVSPRDELHAAIEGLGEVRARLDY
jgi:2-keto-4-pentenoate hydratase